jgi:glycerophosphoryl diester phosphodiesterase
VKKLFWYGYAGAGLILLCYIGVALSMRRAEETPDARARAFPRQLWKKVSVIAHRGDSAHTPENTLPAYERAFALGADMIEADVRLSRDGVPVVFHDETLDRTTNGTGTVEELTLAEIKKLDAGSWMSPEFADERIPTLAETMRLVKSKGGKILLDLNAEGLGPRIAELAREVGLPTSSLVVGTWTDSQTADSVRHLQGAQILRTNDDLKGGSPEFIARVKARGVTGFELGANWSPEFVEAAHAQGMAVYAYTINDEQQMRRLIAMGIDGIETDVPGVLVDVLMEMGEAAAEEE